MGHDLAAAHPRLPRAAEAQEHLRGHAAGHGQPSHRPDPHQLQPDRRRDRPAQLVRSQPAEHSGPDAAGRGDPARVRAPRRLAVFLVADYSQIELRIMAHLSGDPAFIEAFHQGGDIHRQTAALIFGVPVEQVTSDMRARAKTINFATIYGQGPFALSRQLGISQEDAKSVHRPVLRALRRGAGLSRPPDPAGARAGLRGDASSSAGATSRRSRTATSTCAPTASATRRTRRSRARAADLIKLAMIRIHGAIRERRLREPDAAAGPRRAGLRGAARTSSRRMRELVRDPHGARRRSCACRSWWTSGSGPTGWTPSGEPRLTATGLGRNLRMGSGTSRRRELELQEDDRVVTGTMRFVCTRP